MQGLYAKMSPIEDRILSLKTRNFETVPFIPSRELDELLTEAVVRDIILESGIEVQKCEETTRIVVAGAKKILAILALDRRQQELRKFIENDQFQVERLDAKLPFSEPLLHKLLGEATGSLFWERQWMFVAPFFRYNLSHRILEDAAILPFTKSLFIGEGSFGKVSKVSLHPQHQGIRVLREGGPVNVPFDQQDTLANYI